jgi:hypothetical protein
MKHSNKTQRDERFLLSVFYVTFLGIFLFFNIFLIPGLNFVWLYCVSSLTGVGVGSSTPTAGVLHPLYLKRVVDRFP